MKRVQRENKELDEIQKMMIALKDEMPEVKHQLDQLDEDTVLPAALHHPSVPKETWFGRLGNWVVRPGRPFPLGIASGDGARTALLPTFLGSIFVPVILLLWLI